MASKEIDYLIFVTALPTVGFLVLFYFLIRRQGFMADIRELALQVVPNLLAALLAFIIVYAVIQRVLGQNVFETTSSNISTDVRTLSAKSNAELTSEVALMRSTRDALQLQIATLATKLIAAKTPEDKNSISEQLQALALKLADTDTRVGSIEAYLKLVTKADEGSSTIRYLQDRINLLENKLATANAKAAELQTLTGSRP